MGFFVSVGLFRRWGVKPATEYDEDDKGMAVMATLIWPVVLLSWAVRRVCRAYLSLHYSFAAEEQQPEGEGEP